MAPISNDKNIRVLFVDDDEDIRALAACILQAAGMQVICAADGVEALKIWETWPADVLVLDIMMPGMDGLEVCRQVRLASDVPIMLLTALDQESDVLKGFDADVDEYVTKPFRPRELVARIRALHQRATRSRQENRSVYSYAELCFDPVSQRLLVDGQEIALTPVEFRLLLYLIQHPGQAVTKEDLLQKVWGYEEAGNDKNLVEAAVKRLRKKIEPEDSQRRFIHTVWGVGYRFETP
jgi:DNA-binding response OmpR family regulator